VIFYYKVYYLKGVSCTLVKVFLYNLFMNLNKDIKAFFIDLDGTLLNKKNKGIKGYAAWDVGLDNIQAIAEVQLEGKKVIISTGRLGKSAEKFLKKTGVDYLITGNGALIQDSNLNVIYKNNLDKNIAYKVIEFAKKNNMIFKFNDEHISYGFPNKLQMVLSNKFGCPTTIGFNFKEPKNFTKIVMWGKSKKKISLLIEKIKNEVHGIEAVTSGGWTIEITSKGVTKGIANAYLASNVLQLDSKKETLHIGDTMNDHTTAEFQRFVVLKNANKLTKSFASHIADKSTIAGVAKVLRGVYKKI